VYLPPFVGKEKEKKRKVDQKFLLIENSSFDIRNFLPLNILDWHLSLEHVILTCIYKNGYDN
jgi:hypothetical protein